MKRDAGTNGLAMLSEQKPLIRVKIVIKKAEWSAVIFLVELLNQFDGV